MKNCLVTGANGFVGRNLCAHLELREDINLLKYDINNTAEDLREFLAQADFVFHLAGVNRPKEESEFKAGNAGLTQDIVDILGSLDKKIPVLLTSSTQAELDNPYGKSKKEAEDIVLGYGGKMYARVYRFPNLFGKWCRPNYNSVVATFCHNIAHDLPIMINDESHLLTLCYIDDVVRECEKCLEGKQPAADGFCHAEVTYQITLGELADRIRSFRAIRETGVLPDMADDFTRKLHSTYLSYLEEDGFSYFPTLHSDARGWLFELIKQPHAGQIFVSLTKPGITRGNHYHHTKVEKFTVVKGEAVIRFRKIDSGEILEYKVSGEKPEIVDIPPGYTHNIENTGTTDVLTLFWSCELFDPENPDTYYLEVDDLATDPLLRNEYEKYLEFLKSPKFTDIEFTNPLLINYDSRKFGNKDKIMILGQETLDWGGQFNSKFENTLLDHLLTTYKEFYWGEQCFHIRKGAFWNEFRSLRDEYNKINEEKAVFIWNNILKIGKVGKAGHLDNKIIDLYIDYEIIQKELEIIKPKGLIFYTGPYYDGYIERIFKKIKIEKVNGFKRNELSIIRIENEGITGIRTYHPGYLNRLKKDKKVKIRDKMIELLSLL